ncbi:MAG: B12-binding domain-containing radical SAM protein [bacterium]|nr:B12-binding domain-containing radical SAM protein [bacterium]
MKVLLVYPLYPQTFWSFSYALRFIGKKAAIPPMGLLTVAALLPREWELKLVDLNVTVLKDEDILWSDMVFISAMNIQKRSVDRIITKCKELDRKIVAGGPLFTSEKENFPEVDHLVLNEAEITLPRFIDDIENGNPQKVYQADDWADVTESPIPRWDLIKFKHYVTMCIQFSRGCPYDCEFCDITVLYGRKPRVKTAENIIEELDVLYKKGWRDNVFFVDDNFVGNKKRIKTVLLPEMIKWMKKKKHPFTFQTQATINMADDDNLLDLMVNAGFNTVFVGIETPDELSLKECGKRHNVGRDLITNVKKLQNAGLQIQGGFIIGFDSDKKDIFTRVSEFINESGIVTSMVGLLNALPGTKLYNRLKEENRLSDDTSGDNTDFSMNFLPKMDLQVLTEGYRRVIREIYKPDVYYKRVRTFLKTYRQRSKARLRFSKKNFLGLTLSVYKLGIRKGVRRHFWKLMFWTLIRKPKMLPQAITMAIYGANFMKYFDIHK